jgi:UDP-MurNAc hydroxylase
MRLTNYKSATVLIETADARILMDPWFVDGEYYGSWAHYPPVDFDPKELGDVDAIYISHIHPDHFSRRTLEMMSRDIPIYIHDYASPFLKRNVEGMGFKVHVAPHNEPISFGGKTHLRILGADDCDPIHCGKLIGCAMKGAPGQSAQVDSLAVVSDGQHTVVNVNDCPFPLARPALARLTELYGVIDLLLAGYSGAGPYPQCFLSELSSEEAVAAGARKRYQFLEQAADFIAEVKPRFYMPFAGAYLLTGRLAHLNSLRGVPDLMTAKEYLENLPRVRATGSKCVLLDYGESVDVGTGAASAPFNPVSVADREEYISSVLAKRAFDDADPEPSEDELLELLPKAAARLESKRAELGFNSDASLVVPFSDERGAVMAFDGSGFRIMPLAEAWALPVYVGARVDRRLLHRLLRGPRFAHWNNAEVGSHISFKRVPVNRYEPAFYFCLSSFHA